MKKIAIYLFLAILFMPLKSSVHGFEANISKDRLSLHAEGEELQEILRYLAEKNIKIVIDPEINPEITASFRNRELKRGIETLLKSLNYILVWKSIEGPSGHSSRLTEIHVFKSGKRELAIPLNSRHANNTNENVSRVLFIRNEILIRLEKGVSLSELERFLRDTRGVITGHYEATGIYRVILPEGSDVLDILKKMNDYSGISGAEPNYVYRVPLPGKSSEKAGYNARLSDSRLLKGAVPVAVIDTGLDSGAGLDEFVLASLDSLDPDRPVSDSIGHGTQMSMIASGVVMPEGAVDVSNKGNLIIPIKAFDENGYISNFDLMESIDFAAAKGAGVVSLSWGSETKSDFLKESLDHAASMGMVIVASAGNEPTGSNVYPAAYDNVIGVGALDTRGKIWEKSNYGASVSVYAPGFASFPEGENGDSSTYAGTSISAAYVAKLVADHLSENPDASMQEILDYLETKKITD